MPHFSIVFSEEVFVYSLEVEGTADANADIVLDHEIGKSFSVDQNYPLTKVSGEFDGLLAKC